MAEPKAFSSHIFWFVKAKIFTSCCCKYSNLILHRLGYVNRISITSQDYTICTIAVPNCLDLAIYQ